MANTHQFLSQTVAKLQWTLASSNIWLVGFSLVPRPHPLIRRNGLVNHVEFLGLAHAFATIKPFCYQPAQKRYECLNEDEQILLL